MKLFETLDHKNFELFAINHYRNHKCISIEDFHEDLALFKYVLRILRKEKSGKDINLRLLLNHLTVLYNVFEIKAANRMIRFRLEEELHRTLKTCLIYLNLLPENEMEFVSINPKIAKQLESI